jgi:hypothetical protein
VSPNRPCGCPTKLCSSWNSAVFAATPFNVYEVGFVTSDFLEDSIQWHEPLTIIKNLRQNATSLKKLDRTECISRYAGKIAGLPSVLIVSSNLTMSHGSSLESGNSNSSLLRNFTTIDGDGTDWGLNSDWMCSIWALPGFRSSKTCTEQFLMPYNETWTINLNNEVWFKVDHCLSEDSSWDMNTACALRSSPVILTMVAGINFIKCICIAYITYLYKGDVRRTDKRPARGSTHLVTIGDAIASFLDSQDDYTENMDTATKNDFERGWPTARPNHLSSRQRSVRWFRAASMRRWLITMSL